MEASVEDHSLNPRMYNSFLHGTKFAVDVCAVAEALDLEPEVPGIHLPTCEISEIPNTLSPAEDGGILDATGIVDTVSTLHPGGASLHLSISFGVFVVTETPNIAVEEYIEQNSCEGFYIFDDGSTKCSPGRTTRRASKRSSASLSLR